MKRRLLAAVGIAALIAALVIVWAPWRGPTNEQGLTTVKFGMLPYGDHTQAIIGIQKGWFQEVGVKLEPEVIKIENVVPFLKNGTLDVCSSPAGLLYPAYESAPGLGVFVFADIFQGYAIVAQPNQGMKSYDEFLAGGLSREDAFKAAASQLKGKVFAYPSETAIKPFIDTVLEKGGIGRNEFTSLIQDDALNINAMREKRADFQVGGAPSRVVLQREGFKPIITALDIARNAQPSRQSVELASVFPDGWAVTKETFDTRRDLLLRLASVSFRINDLIVNHPDEALAIHMPYLSKVTGEAFSDRDGTIIYQHLDPFYTFQQQRVWFHEPKDPFYYKHINGANLQSFIDKGVYKGSPPDIEDFIYADDIYFELERLKEDANRLFGRIDSGGLADDEAKRALYKKAKYNFDIYNYLDAVRLAQQVVGE